MQFSSDYQVPTHLTPQQYLRAFQTPHSTIDTSTTQTMLQDIQILQSILNIGYNDTPSSAKTKQKALAQLKQIVKDWLQGIQPDINQKCGLEVFGSYRLGVSGRDSDIDAVCIVPNSIERERHFFGEFVEILSKNQNITEMFPIPSALIPIIKIKLYDVQFDILMSRIPNSILETNFEFSDQILDLIDQKERRFLNGCRMAAYIQKNVKNIEVFKITLKAIKMWAKNRGVYLQMFSYLGGIGYTILLAKIVELYPNYSPLKLINRFFFIYSRWPWDVMPIILQQNDNINEKSQVIIMTPICPYTNTSFSVSKTTLTIMKRQFQTTFQTIEQIKKGNKKWNSMFTPYNILKKYKYFLQISVMANQRNDHIMWKGHIQNKFRRLIKIMQVNNQYDNMLQIHPFPKQFVSHDQDYKFCSRYYFAVDYVSYRLQDDGTDIDFSSFMKMFVDIIEKYDDIHKLPESIQMGVCLVNAQSVEKEIGTNPGIFYAHE